MLVAFNFTLSYHDSVYIWSVRVEEVSSFKEVFPWWNIKTFANKLMVQFHRQKYYTIQITWSTLHSSNKRKSQMKSQRVCLNGFLRRRLSVFRGQWSIGVKGQYHSHGYIKSHEPPVCEWRRESLSVVDTSRRAQRPESAWLTGSLKQSWRHEGKINTMTHKRGEWPQKCFTLKQRRRKQPHSTAVNLSPLWSFRPPPSLTCPSSFLFPASYTWNS